MSGPTELPRIPCIGCGALVPDSDVPGPSHAYLGASPGCWALFGEVSAREYSDPAFRRGGRQMIDAYAVQHPGVPERRASQSVWVHLVGLCLVLEHGLPVAESGRAMQRLLAERRAFEWLDPPPSLGTVTVLDVHAAVDPDAHVAAVRSWCDSAWSAWARHHAAVRALAESLMVRSSR